MQRGDQQYRSAIGSQLTDHVQQRRAGRVGRPDAGGEVLGAGDVAQNHSRAGAVRGLEKRNRVRVDLPAHVDTADAFAVDDQVRAFQALRRRGRRPLGPNPFQSRTGRRQLVGVGFGRLFAVQQRIGDLIDPVIVPAGRVATDT